MTEETRLALFPEVQFVLEPGAILPEYSEELASGMDVFALKDIELKPFAVTRVETGLRLAYLDKNYEIQVRSRSGNTLKKNYFVANQPGTIDASYRGFCDVLLFYIPPCYQLTESNDIIFGSTRCRHMYFSTERYVIKAGDKIAQFVVCPVVRPKIVAVKEITNITQRMGSGFGDSGDRSINEKPADAASFAASLLTGVPKS